MIGLIQVHHADLFMPIRYSDSSFSVAFVIPLMILLYNCTPESWFILSVQFKVDLVLVINGIISLEFLYLLA